MIRKLNYTGRQKIPRCNVEIDVRRDRAGMRTFDIRLHLDRLDLPGKAHIYVEAYHRSGYQRFDFGTLEKMRIPEDMRLTRLSRSAIPLFRIKVVDTSDRHGRILGSVDKIRPQSVDDQPADRQTLLHVEFDDLGNKIWELDLEGDWPTLRLNAGAEEISFIAGADYRFLSLVYPEVVRQILTRILIQDDHTDPECNDDDWPTLWLRLASDLPGMRPPPQTEKAERERWIEDAVEAFAVKYNLLGKFNKSLQEGR
ncbi:MAG: hypothetical protein J7M32_01730 [Deltaproteobacteria bacterium]|nr:hypothetical protein [Deltaproteobacteria bacterium]